MTSSSTPADREVFQILVESLPVGVMLTDATGANLHVNEQAARMTGYTVEELKQNVWMVTSDDLMAQTLYQRAMCEHIPGSNYETQLVRKNGTTFWASISWSPVMDNNGQFAGVCTVFMDITERKDTEEALRKANERYRTLTKNVSDILLEWDLDGAITYASESVRTLGYSPAQLEGRMILDFVAPEDLRRVAAIGQRQLASLEPVRYEVCVLAKDGSPVQLEAQVDVVMRDGQPVRKRGVGRDITLRKAAEEELETAHKRYKLFSANSSDMFWETELDGTICYVSEAVRRLGYEPEEWIGHSSLEFIPADEKPFFLDRLDQALSNTRPTRYEISVLTKSGNRVWMEVTIDFILERGKPKRLHGVSRNITTRKHSEQELREANERYQMLAENTSDMFLEWDLDGTITYASQSVRQFGYTHEELIGRNVLDLVPPDVKTFAEHNRRQMLADHEPTSAEVCILTKNGEPRWLESHMSLVFHGDTPVKVHAVHRDITSRKQAENALRESERRYKSIVESSSDLILLTTPEGRIAYASPAAERICGWTPEELVSKNPWVVHPEDTPRMRPILQGARRGEPGSGIEYRILTKSGETRWMSHSWTPIIDGGKVSVVTSVVRDITERVHNEAALKESQERYKSIVENSSDVILLTGADGSVAYVSPACREMLGYEPEELVGVHPEIIYPEDLQKVIEANMQAAAGGSATNFEYRMITKSGDVRWVSHSWSPIFVEDRLYTSVSLVRDITQRRESEEALRKAHAELEQAYKLQQEFVNNVTHEVRTPLTAVKGYAEMLMEGVAGPVSDEQAGLLKKVLMSSQHLLEIVNGILEIARLKSGKVRINGRVCDPRRVVDRCVAVVLPQAQQKGLAITVRSGEAGGPGIYDEEKLLIIITNLLSNAVKFTEKGAVEVYINCGQNGTEIIVSDTGMGIEADALTSIFDEFSQLDYPGKHKPSGFGIGLAIVATMTETIGASLLVSSSKNIGTAFTLYVPAMEA